MRKLYCDDTNFVRVNEPQQTDYFIVSIFYPIQRGLAHKLVILILLILNKFTVPLLYRPVDNLVHYYLQMLTSLYFLFVITTLVAPSGTESMMLSKVFGLGVSV